MTKRNVKYLGVVLVFLLNLVLVKCEDVHLPGLGTLRGSIAHGAWTGVDIYQFLGVNYAEPPLGALRFKAPVPVLPWQGIRNATTFGRICPAFWRLFTLPPEQLGPEIEDCISLCVYTKNFTTSTSVMVFIHGGSFWDGASAYYPPNYLMERDIVLVVPQYRLGPLGFLSMKSDAIPGNAAMLDIILALEWVQSYISYFGGDPTQVTLVGQSAGAAIVDLLSFSPLVQSNLYHQAIIQSGGSMASWIWDDNPIRSARSIGAWAGCGANSTDSEIEVCLMNVPAMVLLFAFTNHVIEGSVNGLNEVGGHRITIGGPSNFLSHNPYQVMRTGGGRQDIVVMAGATKHEGTFLMISIHDYLEQTVGFNNTRFNQFKLIDTVNQIMGVDDQTISLTAYASISLSLENILLRGDYLEMIDPIIDLAGTIVNKGPVVRAAQTNEFLNPNNTWLYSFDYEGEFTHFGWGADVSDYPFPGGVHHADDLIYLFPYPEDVANLNEEDTIMAQQMVNLWTSFVQTGVPYTTELGSTQWSPMTGLLGPYIHIDRNYTVGLNYYDEFTVTSREGLTKRSKN